MFFILTKKDIIQYIILSAKIKKDKSLLIKEIGDCKEYIDLIESIYYKISLMKNEEIFISMASYRDPHTYSTILDILTKAECPSNVKVHCLYQGEKNDENYSKLIGLQKENPNNVFIGFIDYNKSEGLCWARTNIVKEIENEFFFFQVDSHMSFTGHWDSKIKNDYLANPSKKALISGHPAPYYPIGTINEGIPLFYETFISTMESLDETNFLRGNLFKPDNHFLRWNKELHLVPQVNSFISGGYLFGPTYLFKEMPYDPYLYFAGEETDLTVRSYTLGWDLYAPSDCLVWHLYAENDPNKKYHWSDLDVDIKRVKITEDRLKVKMGIIDDTIDIAHLYDIDKYPIGKERTFDEWQAYVGLDLKNKKIVRTRPLP